VARSISSITRSREISAERRDGAEARRYRHLRTRGVTKTRRSSSSRRQSAAYITDIEATARSLGNAGFPLSSKHSATPDLCKPIEYGADIVVASLTKFLGGHGQFDRRRHREGGTFNCRAKSAIRCFRTAAGISWDRAAGLSQFAFAIACVLALRDSGRHSALHAFDLHRHRNAAVRRPRHCDKAMAVTQWARRSERVAWVSSSGSSTATATTI